MGGLPTKRAMLLALAGLAAGAAAGHPQLPASMRLPCPFEQPLEYAGLLDSAAASAGGCNCSEASLCKAVTTEHPKEVFGFTAGDTWKMMDWKQVTTVAWSTDADLVCEAHSHNARLIAAAPLSNITKLGSDAGALTTWVSSVVKMVQALNIDGVTFDYESPIANGAPEAEMYVQIIEATTAALHKAVAGSQTSVCVAWSPNHIDGRYCARSSLPHPCHPHHTLAK